MPNKTTAARSVSPVQAAANKLPEFILPELLSNPLATVWGPPVETDYMKNIPYAPYSKSDSIRKIADWSAPADYPHHRGDDGSHQRRYKQRFGNQESYGSGTALAFMYTHAAEEEASFSIVDRVSAVRKYAGFKARKPQARAFANSGPNARNAALVDKKGNLLRRRYNDKPQRIRDSSVKVGADWAVIEEVEFSRLNKLHFEAEEAEDLAAFNMLNYLDNKIYDRVSTKSDRPLQQSDRQFTNTTTSLDPIMQKLAFESSGTTVFATDSILSVLMCASRSVYSWDIIITKEGDKIFMDKRDGGVFDFISVNENASEAPLESTETDTPNTPAKLSLEATYICRYFSQQILKDNETYNFKETHPDQDTNDAHYAYRYRKWSLGDDISLIARTKVDAVIHQSGFASAQTGEGGPMAATTSSQSAAETLFVSVKALNEYDSRMCGNPDWRQKLDSQRGAVMATEIKNNGCKLAKWTVESILAGTDQIRLGFVSRTNPRDRTRHAVLGTSFFKPREFASQINLSMDNCWGVLRAIVDLCLNRLEDGKYVLLKDPNKTSLRLYKVPADCFEDEDADEIAP